MDQIRCDEHSYLIWKWHPVGSEAGNNTRENAIRYGSSLRVKDGEVAVFVYNQANGEMEEFIEGPYDQMIETKNFPVLASIVGLAYDGGTPFQAEVYYINLARVIQVPFAVPFFDIYDPRFLDFGVPVAVRGRISFNISDYREFIKIHRLSRFDFDEFQNQIKSAIARYVKNIVTNIPAKKNIPVIQIERAIGEINDAIEKDICPRLKNDFGINVSAVDISNIELDKTSDGYLQLKSVTQDIASATTLAQAEVNIKNIRDMQRINAENMEETMRIQREESQYAQHKQTQTANFGAYQVEKQAEVGIAGANALGKMGGNGSMKMSGDGGMNPAGMMSGMMLGGAIGKNMVGMMNGMIGGLNAQPVDVQSNAMTPPPIPTNTYYVVMDGQASGPFDIGILAQMAVSGTLTKDSLVWKQGMGNWVQASSVQELQALFGNNTHPFPGSVPPIPPIV